MEYRISIVVDGKDNASHALGSAGGALSRIGEIAAGILGADIFRRFADGILSMGKNAIQATADFQSMKIGLESLVARELVAASATEKLTTVTRQLSDAEKLGLIESQREQGQLAAKLGEAKTAYEALRQEKGADNEETLRASVALQALQKDYDAVTASIGKMSNTSMILKNMGEPTMKMAEALELAGPKAAQLMKELENISILSPFQNSTVTNTFRTAMAFGYASDEATKYTKAILNVAAGTGATNEMLDRMGYNFAQIRMQGKVTATDIRQLAMAGFDLNGVLRYMGRELKLNINDHEDFNRALANGRITWKQFTDLFAKYSEENFGGAAERASRTLNGLKSTFADVFALSMPKILGPAVEKFTVFANGILDGFMKIRESGVLEEFGDKLGNKVGKFLGAVGRVPKIIKDIKTTFEALGSGAGIRLLGRFLGLDDGAVGKIVEFVGKVEDGIGRMKGSFENGLGNLKTFWEQNGPAITKSFEQIKEAFGSLVSGLFGEQDPGAVFSGIGQAFENGTAWIKDNGPAIADAIQNIADSLTSLGGWIVENKDEILGFVLGFGGALGAIALYGQIPGMITAISGAFAAFVTLAGSLGPVLLIAGAIGWVISVFMEYGNAVLGADAANATFFQKLEVGFWAVLWNASNSVNMLWQIITVKWNEIWTNVVMAFESAKNQVIGKFEELKTGVALRVIQIASAVHQKIDPIITVFDNVKAAVEGIISKLAELFEKLKNAKLPEFLQRHSPSPIELAFGNWYEYAKGLATELPRVQDRMNMPAPAYVGSGSIDQRQINYNLGVTTSQSQDMVERNFAIMQVLANA